MLFGVSKDPDLFVYFADQLRDRCKSRRIVGPSMTQLKDLIQAALFVLHPDKLRSGKEKSEIATTRLRVIEL
ncbi:hypothetical protein PHMEG_0006944 [Phytophthora megakarya]|uniref:Uncharacterized protein n=1 Tax=Phytophthora megakarya TaxID=4795 RepID=A0A225WML5_9STRA|nr:hypothetical protein PHMEG_0006944 [Phytophthora megakarya]